MASFFTGLSSCSIYSYRSILVPDINLNYFSQGKEEILLDFLAKSSQWHVFPLNGKIIAIRRMDEKTCLPMEEAIPSSYLAGVYEEVRNDHFSLPLNPEPHKTRIGETDGFKTSSEDSKISLPIRKVDGLWVSRLTIASRDKSIQFTTNEKSNDETRQKTINNLLAIKNDLSRLIKTVFEQDSEKLISILPAGSSVLSGKESFSITGIGGGSFYTVSGFLNRGKKGFIYLKVFDKKGGSMIRGDRESTNAEYVGWSKDVNRKFSFCLGMRSLRMKLEPYEILPLEFQIWFHPSDNGPEELVYKETVVEKAPNIQ
jgi:hypothetical protein